MPVTAHVAFNKACHYFQVEPKIAPIDDKTGKVKLKDAKKLIDKNTVCLVGSAPNFPHGNYDDIP